MMRQNLVSMPSPWPLALACAALFAGPAPAAGGTPVAVPSGQEVTFVDTVSTAPGPDGLTLRFRQRPGHVGIDEAGRDHIGGDAATADLARQ